MTRAVENADSDTVHFYCASGGNAGLACGTSAIALGHPATIVLPTLAPPLMKKKLLELGVNVRVEGKVWAEADAFVREELLANDPNGVYVPPFDHPHVWDGAASIVTEIQDQLTVPIHGIVCSVGGGGMLNGIMQGVESFPWANRGQKSPPVVVAVETKGADSLNASILAGKHVTLPGITSIATSLGATCVSEKTWQWSQQRDNLQSTVVSDADAAMSCVRFANDARILVEVSCGATLAPAYRGDLREIIGKGMSDGEWATQNVILQVCGGVGVTLETLMEYIDKYAEQSAIKAFR